jgi:hypothetical protein
MPVAILLAFYYYYMRTLTVYRPDDHVYVCGYIKYPRGGYGQPSWMDLFPNSLPGEARVGGR